MKSKIIHLSGLLIMLFFMACSNQGKQQAGSAQKYTCPMHPQITSEGPGTCPICGMDLVPLNDQGGKNELKLSEHQTKLANVRTMEVKEGSFNLSKLLNARLVANNEQSGVISSRFSGRIERLFVKETGRKLQAGEPVFQIYSEELLVLQQDYLLQQRQVKAFPQEKIFKDLLKAAQDKLTLYGYSATQISALGKSQQTSPLITVYAKESGIVNEVVVTEGSYVNEGSPVVRLANLSTVWVEADVYPAEAGQIKEGTTVRVIVNGIGEEHAMKIDYVSPQITSGSQILTVRGSINNRSGMLQPGMQANVLLPSASNSDAVKLPVDAVIRKEGGAHVWVETEKNTFAPRNITTGAEDFEQIVVTSGLKGGEQVVISGAYLLYSEFILKKGTDPASVHKH
jgi:membrane fusion protein, copper/silver efflux system